MAKIKNAQPKKSSGGYERLVNNEKLASIFVKAQSTVISNGSELEKIISEQSQVICDLNTFIDDVKNGKVSDGTYLCTKKVVRESRYKMDKHEPDFIVFIVARDRVCDIVELKDGDSFDTKKSTSEFETLQGFTNHIAPKIPFEVRFYICCFTQSDKTKIVEGFKRRFTEEQVMTGREFCGLLGIDYDLIINERKQDAIDNFNYVIQEMTKISELRNLIKEERRKHIIQEEFYDEP